MNIGLFHWKPRSWGGAEYTITKIAEILGIHTVYVLGSPPGENPFGKIKFVDISRNLSIVDRIKLKLDRIYEYSCWEKIDLEWFGTFDIILTSGSTTRAIITPDYTLHVNYCHSPPRWLYDLYHRRIKKVRIKWLYNRIVSKLRVIDSAVDSRVDYYLANSPIIKRRIWKYYKRESKVLYPPLETTKYRFKEFGDFYLYLGRLDYEKGIINIVKAFKKIELPLKIAGGKGSAFKDVMKLIENSKNIEYMGFVEECEKLELLAECKAVVFNAINEDFGIVPIEANAAGKPCITVKSGFPGLFIKDGINGILHDGSVDGIVNAVKKLENLEFDPKKIKEHAEKFDITNFEKSLKIYLKEFYNRFEKILED